MERPSPQHRLTEGWTAFLAPGRRMRQVRACSGPATPPPQRTAWSASGASKRRREKRNRVIRRNVRTAAAWERGSSLRRISRGLNEGNTEGYETGTHARPTTVQPDHALNPAEWTCLQRFLGRSDPRLPSVPPP